MIYLDNAATTKEKPECVYKAFEYYIRELGVSPGRGSYKLGVEASRMLYKARCTISKYFGINDPNVIFTKNSTEAINLFFCGFLKQGDHVIITCYEHNSVLRPLQTLKDKGIVDYSIISRDDLTLSATDIYKKYAKENTKLFVTTLASNLTGRIILNRNVLRLMKENGIITFIDSSQGAGKIRLSLEEDNIDYVAFTGHKDLLALPGVGGLVCRNTPDWPPLIQGGTGILGDSYTNPKVFPEAYEAGTLNMPAIWSLKTAIDWLCDNQGSLVAKENQLVNYLTNELSKNKKIILYDVEYEKVGVLGLNVNGIQSNKLVEFLDDNDICVRGGIHCAILAHKSLNTTNTGIVRLSLGWLTTKEDLDKVISIIEKASELICT